MLTEEEILSALDNSNNQSNYSHFVELGHPYVYLIDCRLNIFRSDKDNWAIVAERLGFTERGGVVELEITYFGNCLQNLESYNGEEVNNYNIIPVDEISFTESVDDTGFKLKPDAQYWLVNNQKVNLSTKKQDYVDNDIELNENEPGEIAVQDAARLAIVNKRDAFRATDEQLYKCIPSDLKKTLVLDVWHHRDYTQQINNPISNNQISQIFNLNENFNSLIGLDVSQLTDLIKSQESKNEEYNKQQYNENRPGGYETWQQLAKVIVTSDISFYKPTLPPNTHWKNWPESGSL